MRTATRGFGWVVGTLMLVAAGCTPMPQSEAQVAPAGDAANAMDAFGQQLRRPNLNKVRKCKKVTNPRSSGWRAIGPQGGFVFILPVHPGEPLYMLAVKEVQGTVRFQMTEVEDTVAGVEIDAKNADGTDYQGPISASLLVDGRNCRGNSTPSEIGVARVSATNHSQILESLATLVEDKDDMVVQSLIDHLSTYLLATN
ncbi:MAG TPA: hypothetical protein VFI96_02315 [Longimicrobiaceae bacterium]|nr:hypothetical protein [Longimicrobiaceae bacterium]